MLRCVESIEECWYVRKENLSELGVNPRARPSRVRRSNAVSPIAAASSPAGPGGGVMGKRREGTFASHLPVIHQPPLPPHLSTSRGHDRNRCASLRRKAAELLPSFSAAGGKPSLRGAVPSLWGASPRCGGLFPAAGGCASLRGAVPSHEPRRPRLPRVSSTAVASRAGGHHSGQHRRDMGKEGTFASHLLIDATTRELGKLMKNLTVPLHQDLKQVGGGWGTFYLLDIYNIICGPYKIIDLKICPLYIWSNISLIHPIALAGPDQLISTPVVNRERALCDQRLQ